jgi:hypothetical protein
MTKPTSTETERIRELYNADASGYDREMAFFDKVLFAGGRAWVCSRARGDVLELAAGTGRKSPGPASACPSWTPSPPSSSPASRSRKAATAGAARTPTAPRCPD